MFVSKNVPTNSAHSVEVVRIPGQGPLPNTTAPPLHWGWANTDTIADTETEIIFSSFGPLTNSHLVEETVKNISFGQFRMISFGSLDNGSVTLTPRPAIITEYLKYTALQQT